MHSEARIVTRPPGKEKPATLLSWSSSSPAVEAKSGSVV